MVAFNPSTFDVLFCFLFLGCVRSDHVSLGLVPCALRLYCVHLCIIFHTLSKNNLERKGLKTSDGKPGLECKGESSGKH